MHYVLVLEELMLRLRGSWERSEHLDTAEVDEALARFGASLISVVEARPGELRLLVAVPETTDWIVMGEAVARAVGLTAPRITFESALETPTKRGVAGPGHYCSCGGVDGDHADGCPRKSS
ncbi:hypothetical protein ACQEU3_42190 [Spirillospora sp. CA-253888]